MDRTSRLRALLAEREPVVAKPGSTFKIAGKPRDGLYGFQAAAEDVLRDESRSVNLLVTARTGGGKTYVIEAAFRVARQRSSVLLVGEPLVALALQVQERLGGAPGGAALTTGPIKRRSPEDASAYVGTYEALAAMCASDHPALAACSHVALDEVHNIASEDRAQAIQEILDYCRRLSIPVIGLSGTLPNDWKVAEYLSAVNGLDTCIVGSNLRPVPLEKFYYDRADGRFWPLVEQVGPPDTSTRSLGGIEGRQDLIKLLRALEAGDWLPALVVNFSCRVLDEWAAVVYGSLNLLERRGDRSRVAAAFDAATAAVAPQDRPLYDDLRRYASRGVFLHHGHLPPRYNALVVALAGDSLAPLVLTTSTLAMGLNLPTRTVVLTSVRMPQRTDENTVELAPVDPKLVHQLQGRAGRKGYEPVGYAVYVGYGMPGFRQAIAFDARPLPPVTASDRFSHGDVLRAAVQGRCLAMDREAFDSGGAFELRVLVGHAESLAARALSELPPDARREVVRASAASLVELLAAETSLRDLVAAPGEEAWLCRSDDGEFAIGAEGVLRLRAPKAQPLKRLPLELAARALELRDCARRLLESQLSRDEWLACSVLARASARLAELSNGSGFRAVMQYKRDLCLAGLLTDSGAPTELGVACARVRSCPNPAAVVPMIGEDLDPEELVRLASTLVGDGALFAGESGCGAVVGVRPSAPRFVEAAMRWIRGESLCAIHEAVGVSCGEMCRHVVRSRGLLLEVREAAAAAGRASLEAFDEAEQYLKKGGGPMPFELDESDEVQ